MNTFVEEQVKASEEKSETRVQKRMGHFSFYEDTVKRRRSSNTSASEAVSTFLHSKLEQ